MNFKKLSLALFVLTGVNIVAKDEKAARIASGVAKTAQTSKTAWTNLSDEEKINCLFSANLRAESLAFENGKKWEDIWNGLTSEQKKAFNGKARLSQSNARKNKDNKSDAQVKSEKEERKSKHEKHEKREKNERREEREEREEENS